MEDKMIRQRDLIEESIYDKYVAVAGCGATGHQVARILTFMGIKDIIVIDPDVVNLHNCTVQGFQDGDIGMAKVKAFERSMQYNNSCPDIQEVKYEHTTWGDKYPDVVVMCTDTMESRKAIWKWCKEKHVQLVLDSRVLGNLMQIYVIPMDQEKATDVYEESVNRYDDKTAEAGRCTARMTLYGATMAASWLVRGIVMWNKRAAGIPLQVYSTVNLLMGTVDNEIELDIVPAAEKGSVA